MNATVNSDDIIIAKKPAPAQEKIFLLYLCSTGQSGPDFNNFKVR
jgi:hypothetical protein